MRLTSPVFAAGNVKTYTNASEIAVLVSDGYNKGTKGPILFVAMATFVMSIATIMGTTVSSAVLDYVLSGEKNNVDVQDVTKVIECVLTGNLF